MIWWLGFVEKASLLRGESRFLIADSCDGINCNPSCPKGVDLGSIRNDWTTSLLGIGTISILSFLIAGMFLLYRVIMTFRRRKLCKDVLAMSGKDTSGLKVSDLSDYCRACTMTPRPLQLQRKSLSQTGHYFCRRQRGGRVWLGVGVYVVVQTTSIRQCLVQLFSCMLRLYAF